MIDFGDADALNDAWLGCVVTTEFFIFGYSLLSFSVVPRPPRLGPNGGGQSIKLIVLLVLLIGCYVC